MLYPAYVELGSENQAFGVALPDFPGCYTATDTQEDLPRMVQEAVELYFEEEDLTLPEPSQIKDWKKSTDFNYNGVWMMFDIDISKISTKSKRINISFPENLLAQLDNKAK